MPRWFFRSKKRETKHIEHRSGRPKPRSARAKYRKQPAPLTWNNPEQDFITRAGDPFDG